MKVYYQLIHELIKAYLLLLSFLFYSRLYAGVYIVYAANRHAVTCVPGHYFLATQQPDIAVRSINLDRQYTTFILLLAVPVNSEDCSKHEPADCIPSQGQRLVIPNELPVGLDS